MLSGLRELGDDAPPNLDAKRYCISTSGVESKVRSQANISRCAAANVLPHARMSSLSRNDDQTTATHNMVFILHKGDEKEDVEEVSGLTSGHKKERWPASSSCWSSTRMLVVVMMACIILGITIGLGFAACAPWLLSLKRNDGGSDTMKAALSFLVLGDWGRNGEYNQSTVAESMGRVAAAIDSSFVISTGDNFYEDGLDGIEDPQFESSFSKIYTAESLYTRWYSVLGNHDYRKNAWAQLDPMLKERDARWHCERSFKVQHSACPKHLFVPCEATMDIFFVDTTPMVKSMWEDKYNFTGLSDYPMNLHFQLLSLRTGLQSSSAKWKLVVGHHPVRSTGDHGDTAELVKYLLPILEENGVDIYINGHDHDLELIKRDDSPVLFMTSGGGSKAYREKRNLSPGNGSMFFHVGQGFASVSLDSRILNINLFDVFGSKIFSYSLLK